MKFTRPTQHDCTENDDDHSYRYASVEILLEPEPCEERRKHGLGVQSRDALDAGIPLRPTINRTGATTPPERIAPANHEISRRCSCMRCAPMTRRYKPRPRPDPRYSNPANSQGDTALTSDFASGVPAPNNNAARRPIHPVGVVRFSNSCTGGTLERNSRLLSQGRAGGQKTVSLKG